MGKQTQHDVSMPSRADGSFLRDITKILQRFYAWCQCPLGLMAHFYVCSRDANPLWISVSMPSRADGSFLQSTKILWVSRHSMTCQCPLGLMAHFYRLIVCVSTLMAALCQCPLGLMAHFYGRHFAVCLTSCRCVNALSG